MLPSAHPADDACIQHAHIPAVLSNGPPVLASLISRFGRARIESLIVDYLVHSSTHGVSRARPPPLQVRLNRLFSAQDAILLDKQQMMIISLLQAANGAEARSLPAPDFVKQPSSRGLPMYAIGVCIPLCFGRHTGVQCASSLSSRAQCLRSVGFICDAGTSCSRT